jgi:hypothetical protein
MTRNRESVYGAAVERMTRVQFVEATAELDHDRLRQILRTLYWRGPAAVRSRIEGELSPSGPGSKGVAPSEQVDPDAVLAQVSEFVSLARSGAYLGRDRRVSPKERTRWRYTFKQLNGAARQAMLGERGEATGDPGSRPGAAAMGLLIDLACEMRGYDYVRSQDPVAAAGLVVSDEVALMWGRMLARDGVAEFAPVAVGQLLRWESRYGWIRRGEGPVARRETTLAQVLAGLLAVPDAWEVATKAYLAALDAAAGADRRDVPTSCRTGTASCWTASSGARPSPCWTVSPGIRSWPVRSVTSSRPTSLAGVGTRPVPAVWSRGVWPYCLGTRTSVVWPTNCADAAASDESDPVVRFEGQRGRGSGKPRLV